MMINLSELFGGGMQSLSHRDIAFIDKQAKRLEEIGELLESHRGEISDLTEQLYKTHRPNGYFGFIEVGEFEGYNTLEFFYSLAKFLDSSFMIASSMALLSFSRSFLCLSKVFFNSDSSLDNCLKRIFCFSFSEASILNWFDSSVRRDSCWTLDTFKYLFF